MSRQTTTAAALVTVNAAFLQELKDVNQELWKALLFLRERLSNRVQADELAGLLDLLRELRDQLALHFALEEAYGYFEGPLQVAPQLSEQADSLREEHREIYLDLGEIIEQAERMFFDDQISALIIWIGPRFISFDVRLKDHERRENELISDAYECDIGVGD